MSRLEQITPVQYSQLGLGITRPHEHRVGSRLKTAIVSREQQQQCRRLCDTAVAAAAAAGISFVR